MNDIFEEKCFCGLKISSPYDGLKANLVSYNKFFCECRTNYSFWTINGKIRSIEFQQFVYAFQNTDEFYIYLNNNDKIRNELLYSEGWNSKRSNEYIIQTFKRYLDLIEFI